MLGLHSLFGLLFLPCIALAQEPRELVSGPEPGAKFAPVRVYFPSGARAGRELDLRELVGDRSAALLFIHDLTRETAQIIRGLDGIAAELSILGLQCFPIFLKADRTEAETRLRTVNRAIRLQSPICLSLDGAEGPGTMALNRKCTLTLVLVKDRKVTRSVAMTDTGAKDIPKLRRWCTELTGPLPRDPGELARLIRNSLPTSADELRRVALEAKLEIYRLRRQLSRQAQGRRQRARQRPMRPRADAARRRPGAASRPRQGKAPDDPKLRSLLRAFVRRTAGKERIDELVGEIAEHVGEDEALKQQASDMFKLLLGFPDRYGTDYAKEKARAWLKQHAKKRKL